MSLTDLLNEIDDLVARASVEEDDSPERIEYLKQASAKACKFFMVLDVDLDALTASLLDLTSMGSEGSATTVKQLMYEHDVLRPLRDANALKHFILSSRQLFESAGMDRDALRGIQEDLEKLLPDIQGQKLAPSELTARIRLLKAMFCSPPGGGRGALKPKPSGPTPPAEGQSKWGRRFGHLGTLANIGRLIAILMGHHDAVPLLHPPDAPHDLPPWEEQVRFFGLLALAAFADSLKASGEISLQVKQRKPADGVFAGQLQEA